MPNAIRTYVRYVDAVNRRVAMYLIFAMAAILLWSSVSKTFFVPSLWTLEMAQFAMVAYYLLGGPYSMQLDGVYYGEDQLDSDGVNDEPLVVRARVEIAGDTVTVDSRGRATRSART